MLRIHRIAPVVAVAILASAAGGQAAMDDNKAVAGGIKAAGWAGKADANRQNHTVDSASFAAMGTGFHVRTGPAITYWNPANRATGNYTVKATFNEPKFMYGTTLNNHAHPYGIVIAGNDLGTDQESYLYCAAYGSGIFIVRGKGPMPFQMNGARGGPHAAVNKAAGPGQPVTQEIAVSVRGDNVECAINGQVVGTYPKSSLVTAGKLKSTDGVYGVRFAHNTEAMVTNLTITRH